MKRALLINRSATSKDPRPLRMRNWLIEGGFSCSNLCVGASNENEIEIENKLKTLHGKVYFILCLLVRNISGLVRYFFININSELRNEKFDVVVVSDLLYLPLALSMKSKRVVFDAREYYIRQFEDDLKWKLLIMPIYKFIHYKFIDKPDILFSVSHTIVNKYQEDRPNKPCIFLPSYARFADIVVDTESRFGDKIRLIHHGFCNKQRKIETMIELMDKLGNEYTLDFYFAGMASTPYQKNIKDLVDNRKNIRILQPIPIDDLISKGSKYDFGLVVFPNDTTYNVKYSLSNKIFEMIQSRLPLIIGGVSESKYLFDTFDVGVHSPEIDLEMLAEEVTKIDKKRYDMIVSNVNKCASEINLENQKALFLSVVKNDKE